LKNGVFVQALVINDENKLAVPLIPDRNEARNLDKPCIIKGYLVFKYLKPKNNDLNSPTNGHLFLNCSEFVRLISPEEILLTSIPCVKQIPEIEAIKTMRKNFITGYYCDADARSLKNFIINMMKKEMEI